MDSGEGNEVGSAAASVTEMCTPSTSITEGDSPKPKRKPKRGADTLASPNDKETSVTAPVPKKERGIEAQASYIDMPVLVPPPVTESSSSNEPIATLSSVVETDGSSVLHPTESKWTLVQKAKKIKANTAEIDHAVVYMKGTQSNPNFARDVSRSKGKSFKEQVTTLVGVVISFVMAGPSVLITCSKEQATKLLKVREILGGSVEVSPPRESKKSSGKWEKGVIRKVPIFLEISQITTDSEAIWGHRIVSTRGEKKQPTKTVILAFQQGKAPKTVDIGLSTYTIERYIPIPLRCAKCQRYGHKAVKCTAKADTCRKCGDTHNVKFRLRFAFQDKTPQKL
jgi:hypothetical protein